MNTLMPSRHDLKYIDGTVHLFMFQRPKVNIGFTVNIVYINIFVNYNNIGSDNM